MHEMSPRWGLASGVNSVYQSFSPTGFCIIRVLLDLARACMNSGDLAKALDLVNHMIDTRPDFLQAFELKGWILYALGEKRESIDTFKLFRKKSPSPIAGLAGLSYVYARTMQTKLAEEVKELMNSVAQDMPSYLPHYGLALAHLGAQEYALMFEQLNLAVKERIPVMIFLCARSNSAAEPVTPAAGWRAAARPAPGSTSPRGNSRPPGGSRPSTAST